MSGRAHARVGVVGCTGYVGSEVCRWLLGHPRVELASVVARSAVGKPLGEAVPSLLGLSRLIVEELDYQALAGLDAVVLCMPHGAATDIADGLSAARAPRILDLASDHRFVDGWTYGLVDWNEAEVRASRRIAVPGCFATAIELSLAPLAAAGALKSAVHVAASTGSTGSGVAPSAGTHHPERFANFKAYKVFNHQHVPEIRSFLAMLSGHEAPPVRLVPTSAPLDRGIFATCFATVDPSLDARSLYRAAYEQAPLVRIRDESPEIRHVRGSAFADLAVHQDGEAVVVLCAIDNLGKGAASQAVQCLNLSFGWPAETGLMVAPCTP